MGGPYVASRRIAADKLQSNQPDLVRDNKEMAFEQARLDDLKARMARDASFVAVTPMNPDQQDAIQVTGLEDYRPMVEGGIAAFFAVSSLLLIGISRRKAHSSSGSDYEHDSQDDHHTPIGHQPLTAA